jgi:methyl-accepting chemotaxis protein
MKVVAERFRDSAVLAASTAGEFTEARDAKGSVSAVAICGDFEVRTGMGTQLGADVVAAVSSALADTPQQVEGYPHRTAIMLLDPLTGKGEEASLVAATLLGPEVPLAGGAAGDDLKMASTEVALGDRVASDALVTAVIFSKSPLGLGVCHGHLPVSETLTVTRADGATVYEIDGRPAWEVWAERTRGPAKRAGMNPDTLAPSDVGAYLLRYEAGLRTGDDYKIRAPLSRGADGSLSFACGIPEGAEIRITESEPERQVTSARSAASKARAALGGRKVAGAVVFDCICRNLILDQAFQQAVAAISEELGSVPLAGFETYGEIALAAGDMSGFHNTTTVVLAFPE